MMKGTVRGIGYLLVGILIIFGGIITVGMMFSATHVTLNIVLQALIIVISVLEIIIGLIAINFGVNRLRLRVSVLQ